MGRPLVIAWHAEDTPAALKGQYQTARRADERTRLQALWLLREGWPVTAVTAAVGAHYRTVQRWLADYRAGGVAAVITRHKGGHGQPRRLSPDQEAALAAEASRGSFRTATEARQWLRTRYGVTYTEGGMYSVLARLRVHPKVPRPANPKADPAVQQAWKKGISPQPSRQPA